MFLSILNFLYLCIWAILLIHCLTTKRLYPIFGNGWSTKIFWLFTFVFFNPLLSLLYIFCLLCAIKRNTGPRAHDPGKNKENVNNHGKRLKIKAAIPVFAFVYTCVVLILFEIPRTTPKIQPFVVLSKTNKNSIIKEKALLKRGLNLGIVDAKNKIQTVSSDSASEGMKMSLRNIVLICKNKSDFLERTALKMQQNLLKLPYVKSVSYYSSGFQPEPEDNPSDVYIILEMPELIEDTFILNRKMQVKINCAASNSISEILPDSTEKSSLGPKITFEIKSEIQHISSAWCIECPGTEYEHEVKNVSSELTKAIKKQFDNLLNKYEELPEILYGSHIESQDF